MTLASIPSPSVSQLRIGSLTIHYYALCILAGVIVAVWLTARRWKRNGGTFDQILDLALISVPMGLVGARLYHIITTPERFFGAHGDWVEMFRLWNGGLGIWGGIALGALTAWLWCKHRHYPAALLADAAAPSLLLAQGIGRLGNWFNQELYGAPTTLPWGLQIDAASSAIGHSEQCYDGLTCPTGTLFHPTFLYELLWNIAGALLLLWLSRSVERRLKAGTLFAGYVMWYTLGRTWIEALRIDFAHEWYGVRINVWVSLAVCTAGVIAAILIQRYGKPSDILAEKLRAITELEQRQRDDASFRAAPSIHDHTMKS